MRSIPPGTLKRIQRFLSEHGEVALANAVGGALVPKKAAAPAAKRRALKKRTQRDAMAEIRAEVVQRAGLFCEACANPFTFQDPLEVDHFFGGSGRRLAMQSTSTLWALHRSCHAAKTANRPSAIHWIRRFALHCDRLGYAQEARFAESRLNALVLRRAE